MGRNGNDTLNGGVNVDTMIGGFGDDIYIVDNFNDTVTELFNQGFDEVRTSTNYMLPAGASIELLRIADETGTTLMVLNGNS